MSDKTLQLAKLTQAFSFNSSHVPTQIDAGIDNITIQPRSPANAEGLDGNMWFDSTTGWLYIKVTGQWRRTVVEHDMVQYEIIIGDPYPEGITWDQDRQQIRITNPNFQIPIAVVSYNGTVLTEGENYTINPGGGQIQFNSLAIEDSDRITVTGQIEEGDGTSVGGLDTEQLAEYLDSDFFLQERHVTMYIPSSDTDPTGQVERISGSGTFNPRITQDEILEITIDSEWTARQGLEEFTLYSFGTDATRNHHSFYVSSAHQYGDTEFWREGRVDNPNASDQDYLGNIRFERTGSTGYWGTSNANTNYLPGDSVPQMSWDTDSGFPIWKAQNRNIWLLLWSAATNRNQRPLITNTDPTSIAHGTSWTTYRNLSGFGAAVSGHAGGEVFGAQDVNRSSIINNWISSTSWRNKSNTVAGVTRSTNYSAGGIATYRFTFPHLDTELVIEWFDGADAATAALIIDTEIARVTNFTTSFDSDSGKNWIVTVESNTDSDVEDATLTVTSASGSTNIRVGEGRTNFVVTDGNHDVQQSTVTWNDGTNQFTINIPGGSDTDYLFAQWPQQETLVDWTFVGDTDNHTLTGTRLTQAAFSASTVSVNHGTGPGTFAFDSDTTTIISTGTPFTLSPSKTFFRQLYDFDYAKERFLSDTDTDRLIHLNDIYSDRAYRYGIRIGNNANATPSMNRVPALAIGHDTNATAGNNWGAIAIGRDVSAWETDVNIGLSNDISSNTNSSSVALGAFNISGFGNNQAFNTVAVGRDNRTEGAGAVAIGSDCIASGASSTAIGGSRSTVSQTGGPRAFGDFSISIGSGAQGFNRPLAEHFSTIAIGRGSGAAGDYSIAIGQSADTNSENSIAFGNSAITDSNSPRATAIGYSCRARGVDNVAIGTEVNATGDSDAVCMGARSTSSGTRATAVGADNTSAGLDSTAVGAENHASGNLSLAMGVENITTGEATGAVGVHNECTNFGGITAGRNNFVGGFASGAVGADNYIAGDFSVAMGGRVYIPSGANNNLAMGLYTNITQGSGSIVLGTGIANPLTYTDTEIMITAGDLTLGYITIPIPDGHDTFLTLPNDSEGRPDGFDVPIEVNDSDITNEQFDRLRYAYDRMYFPNGFLEDSDVVRVRYFGVVSTESRDTDAIAIGTKTKAKAQNAIAIGREAIANGVNSLSIGAGSEVTGENAQALGIANTVIGNNVATAGRGNVVYGSNSGSLGGVNQIGSRAVGGALSPLDSDTDLDVSFGVALGARNLILSDWGVALGTLNQINTNSTRSVAVGYQCIARDSDNVAVGSDTKSEGVNSVALGVGARAFGTESLSLGVRKGSDDNLATGANSIAIGSGCHAYSDDSIAIGEDANAYGQDTIVIGDGSDTGADTDDLNVGAIAIGNSTQARHSHSIAFGNNVHTDTEGQVNFHSTDSVLRGVSFPRSTTEPAGMPVGTIYFDTSTGNTRSDKLRVLTSTGWVNLH